MSDNNSKSRILGRLRQRPQAPFALPKQENRQMMQPVADESPQGLLELFSQQAEVLKANIVLDDPYTALGNIIGEDRKILAWDLDLIPLPELSDWLVERQITVADPHDASVRIGITGADAALAATGSLVLSAKAGHHRTASLLPLVHIAVIRRAQILPHFEAWIDQQRANLADFRAIGNHVIISGASRTADIAMELVLGAHGPQQLHILVVDDA